MVIEMFSTLGGTSTFILKLTTENDLLKLGEWQRVDYLAFWYPARAVSVEPTTLRRRVHLHREDPLDTVLALSEGLALTGDWQILSLPQVGWNGTIGPNDTLVL